MIWYKSKKSDLNKKKSVLIFLEKIVIFANPDMNIVI